jgi:1-acyl-sn-glycerol-3-phosphate acyltransferase
VLLLSRVRITGREHIPDGGFILAPNHPSQLDAFFAAVALGRRVRFMAKSDLFTRRWGRWLARVGAFPVRRGVWDEEAFETAETLLDRGKVLAMFFEGGSPPRAATASRSRGSATSPGATAPPSCPATCPARAGSTARGRCRRSR